METIADGGTIEDEVDKDKQEYYIKGSTYIYYGNKATQTGRNICSYVLPIDGVLIVAALNKYREDSKKFAL